MSLTTKTLAFMGVFATALLTRADGGSDAATDLIGFWDFKGGMDGEAVTTVANSLGETTYTSDTAKKTNNTGRIPTYSSQGPGRVVECAGGGTLCADPGSIDFRYADRTNRQGGYFDIPSLAQKLSTLSSYTIEYFIKFPSDYNYFSSNNIYDFTSKTAVYVKSGISAYKLIAPASADRTTGHPNGLKLETYPASTISGETISGGPIGSNLYDCGDDAWHHVAVVYKETDTSRKTGTLYFYVDWTNTWSRAFAHAPGTSTEALKFRLGSGYKNADGQDKTTTESLHASLSCLRVTGTALTPAAFMLVDPTPDISGMDTAGFWDFKDGTAGEPVALTRNTIAADLFPGKGSATTKVMPTFSAERPGRYVFTSQGVLAENPQSVYFGTGVYDEGGKVELDALATALTRLDTYTIEFFFKIDQPTFSNYRSLVGWRTGDANAVKVNLTGNVSGYNKATFEVLTNATPNTVAGCARNTSVEISMGHSWHHFAAVYSKADNEMWTYIDKIRSPTPAALTNALPMTQHPLVLGNSALSFKQAQEVFGGYISCVRVTPRALNLNEFMVASDLVVPEGTVFALNFDEGSPEQAVVAANTGATGVKIHPYQSTCDIIYNLHSECRPRYAETEKKGRQLKWGQTSMWTNSLCLWFPAASHLPAGAQNAEYYGAMLTVPAQTPPDKNPASWTMEAMVKLERTGLPQSKVKRGLIFGKAGNRNPTNNANNPSSSWLLSYDNGGSLVLEWTEKPTADYADYSAGSSFYKKVSTAETYLQDLKWHHVALSYSAVAKRFLLYVDGTIALEQPLLGTGETNTLYDGPYAYFFCRFPTTSGFEGWMDEIRFTSRVLDPADFEQYVPTGTFLIFR